MLPEVREREREREDEGQKKVQYLRVDFDLFDLILYVPSTIFQVNRDVSSWVEPVLS